MSILSSRYGVRRPQEIAARLESLRAHCFRGPIATERPATVAAPIEAPKNEAREVETPFVQLFPHLRESHLMAQRRMFAAAKTANLSDELAPRLSGINALLGSDYRSSRTLSPSQLHTVANAIESGLFAANWTLCDDAPLPDAPEETEELPEIGNPAPLESLDEMAMDFDLDRMRRADRARALNALRAEKITLETRLCAVDRAILCA